MPDLNEGPMRHIAAILTAACWTGVFALLAAFALFAAEDGAPATVAMFGVPMDTLAVASLPGRAVMGGLSFGACVVAALFATAGLSIAMLNGREKDFSRFLVELAHGGAFGIAGLVVLSIALASNGWMLATALGVLATLVASLVTMRAALSEIPPPVVDPNVLARRMAEAAAANSNVVRFPYYRVGGAT